MTLSGFPTNAQSLGLNRDISGVDRDVEIHNGTVTISGDHAFDVLTVLKSLKVTPFDYDDANFVILFDGTATDTNGITTLSDPFSMSHVVRVQAVGNAPYIYVGSSTTTVEENSDFEDYPVVIRLLDTDGSETYQSVVIAFSTPRICAAPQFRFGTTNGVTFTNTTDQITLKGSASEIEAALVAMRVRPVGVTERT